MVLEAPSPADEQFLVPGPAINGVAVINLAPEGTGSYTINESYALGVYNTAGDGPDIGDGTAYIDNTDRGVVKFSNDPTIQYSQFVVDHFSLKPKDSNMSWYSCPYANSTGAFALRSAAGDGCGPISSNRTIQVSYLD